MEQLKNHVKTLFGNKDFRFYFAFNFIVGTPIFIKNIYDHFQNGTIDFWFISSWIVAYMCCIWSMPMVFASIDASSRK